MHWMPSTSFRQRSAARNRAGGNAVVHAHHHARQAEAAARSSSLARERARARAVAHKSAKARSIASSPHRATSEWLPTHRSATRCRIVPCGWVCSDGWQATGIKRRRQCTHKCIVQAELRRTREGRSVSGSVTGRTSRKHCPLRCRRIVPLRKS